MTLRLLFFMRGKGSPKILRLVIALNVAVLTSAKCGGDDLPAIASIHDGIRLPAIRLVLLRGGIETALCPAFIHTLTGMN